MSIPSRGPARRGTRSRPQPRARRAPLHDDARRSGRGGDQGRAAGHGRRHPPVGPARGCAGPRGAESAYYLCANRNKRSVAADLKSEAGRALVRRLARGADVLVENFAPGMLEGWGLGYERSPRDNPGLVFCSITGYGREGPEAGRPGYDFAVQARAGWMAITGEPDGAPDEGGGRGRGRSHGPERGHRASSRRCASATAPGWASGSRWRCSIRRSPGWSTWRRRRWSAPSRRRYGNAHPTIVPYQAFRAADRDLVVAVGNDAQWRRLCAALGLEGARRRSRASPPTPRGWRTARSWSPLLAERLRERPAAEWLARLDAAGVPCAPVHSLGDAHRRSRPARARRRLEHGGRHLRGGGDGRLPAPPLAHAAVAPPPRSRPGGAHRRDRGGRAGPPDSDADSPALRTSHHAPPTSHAQSHASTARSAADHVGRRRPGVDRSGERLGLGLAPADPPGRDRSLPHAPPPRASSSGSSATPSTSR